MDNAWRDSTAFSETIHRAGRFFRFRKDEWLRRHLESDLSAEIAALASEYLPGGGVQTAPST